MGGIKTRLVEHDAERTRRMVRELRIGSAYSRREIAKELGVSEDIVAHILNELGLSGRQCSAFDGQIDR